jgi:hypothetical protein
MLLLVLYYNCKKIFIKLHVTSSLILSYKEKYGRNPYIWHGCQQSLRVWLHKLVGNYLQIGKTKRRKDGPSPVEAKNY